MIVSGGAIVVAIAAIAGVLYKKHSRAIKKSFSDSFAIFGKYRPDIAAPMGRIEWRLAYIADDIKMSIKRYGPTHSITVKHVKRSLRGHLAYKEFLEIYDGFGPVRKVKKDVEEYISFAEEWTRGGNGQNKDFYKVCISCSFGSQSCL